MEKIEFNVFIACRDDLPIDEQITKAPPFDERSIDEICDALRDRLKRAVAKRRGYALMSYGPTSNMKQGF